MIQTQENFAPGGASQQVANGDTVVAAVASDADIFDRYAESVIRANAHDYDALEVHGVRNCAADTEDGTNYEIDNINPTSFSVYAHLKEGGIDCVGDFTRYSDAKQYSAELATQYGWPTRNFVLDRHRNSALTTLQ